MSTLVSSLSESSVPIKHFISWNGIKGRSNYHYFYQKHFWAFPDPPDNLKSSRRYNFSFLYFFLFPFLLFLIRCISMKFNMFKYQCLCQSCNSFSKKEHRLNDWTVMIFISIYIHTHTHTYIYISSFPLLLYFIKTSIVQSTLVSPS